jgi:hypothetical protein
MLTVVSQLPSKELVHWEQAAQRMPIGRRQHNYGNYNRGVGLKDHMVLSDLTSLLSDFKLPEADTHAASDFESEDEFEPQAYLKAPACDLDGADPLPGLPCCDFDDGVLSDFPSPEAFADDVAPTTTCVADHFAAMLESYYGNTDLDFSVSQGLWLASQQELKVKDFMLAQLTRQLFFERGREDWLKSEQQWRETREQHFSCFAQDGCTGVADHDALQAANMQVTTSMTEDQRLEECYNSNFCSFWTEEARSIDMLLNDIEQQSCKDHSEMTGSDKDEYDKHLLPIFSTLTENFKFRRQEANQLRREIVQDLHSHLDTVRKRHLHVIAQVSHLDEDHQINVRFPFELDEEPPSALQDPMHPALAEVHPGMLFEGDPWDSDSEETVASTCEPSHPEEDISFGTEDSGPHTTQMW